MAASRLIWWSEYRADELADGAAAAAIVVLPVAAIEQHGPHLPLSTDADIMAGMIATVADLLPDDLDVRFLPIQHIGKSNEHVYAPGTLSHRASTLIDLWTELGASVAAAGVRKIVIVTSHGGNEEVMGVVARELRVRFGMLAVKSSWSRFGYPDGLYSDAEISLGIHGGDIETSLMLHFRPELVDRSAASDFESAWTEMEGDFDLLRPTGPFGFSWIARDLNPAGVVGNASAARADKGARTAAHQAAGFVRLLKDLARADSQKLLRLD